MRVEFKDLRLKRLTPAPQSEERVRVGLQKQLMVDDYLDADGKAIPGFSGKDAPEYQAMDDLRLKPAWKNDKDLSALKGKVVRIRFRLRNARLYAFQIQ